MPQARRSASVITGLITHSARGLALGGSILAASAAAGSTTTAGLCIAALERDAVPQARISSSVITGFTTQSGCGLGFGAWIAACPAAGGSATTAGRCIVAFEGVGAEQL